MHGLRTQCVGPSAALFSLSINTQARGFLLRHLSSTQVVCALTPGAWADTARLWPCRAAFLSGPSRFTERKLPLDKMQGQVPFRFATPIMDKWNQQPKYASVFQNTDGVNFYNILTKIAPKSAMKSSLEFTQSHLGEWALKLPDWIVASVRHETNFFEKPYFIYCLFFQKYSWHIVSASGVQPSDSTFVYLTKWSSQ